MKSSIHNVLIGMISITLVAGCSATPSNPNPNTNNTTPVSTNTTTTEQQPTEQQNTTQPTNNWTENNNQNWISTTNSDPNKLLETTLQWVPVQVIPSVKAASIANEMTPGKKAKTLKLTGSAQNPIWDITMDDGSQISINAKDGITDESK